MSMTRTRPSDSPKHQVDSPLRNLRYHLSVLCWYGAFSGQKITCDNTIENSIEFYNQKQKSIEFYYQY